MRNQGWRRRVSAPRVVREIKAWNKLVRAAFIGARARKFRQSRGQAVFMRRACAPTPPPRWPAAHSARRSAAHAANAPRAAPSHTSRARSPPTRALTPPLFLSPKPCRQIPSTQSLDPNLRPTYAHAARPHMQRTHSERLFPTLAARAAPRHARPRLRFLVTQAMSMCSQHSRPCS